jgi:hypothetical protein
MYVCVYIYIYIYIWGAGIKAWKYVVDGNKEVIGKHLKFLIKHKISVCRGGPNPCHIQTQNKFVSSSNSGT